MVDDDPFYDDLPALQECSEDEGDDSAAESVPDLEEADNTDEAILAHAEHVHGAHPPVQPVPVPVQPQKPAVAAKGKITSYWKVETAAEKAVRLEKDARLFSERAEEIRLREVEDKRKKKARARVIGNERMRRHRERARDKKIAAGLGCAIGQKRVSTATPTQLFSAADIIVEAR
jgi:hypothetical protein